MSKSSEMTIDKSAEKQRLDVLARDVQQSHRACVTAIRKTLGHARRAGQLLNEAKPLVTPGHWIAWLEGDCKVERREAQRYMRIASGWDVLVQQGDVGKLTLTQALKVLSGGGSSDESAEAEAAQTTITARPVFQITRPDFERKRYELNVLRSSGGTPFQPDDVAKYAAKVLESLRKSIRCCACQLVKSDGDVTLAAIAIAEALKQQLDAVQMFDVVDDQATDSGAEPDDTPSMRQAA